MAQIVLVHVLFRRKITRQALRAALDDIRDHRRLFCRSGANSWQGQGVYAYYERQVPPAFHGDPMVVLEVDETVVRRVGPPSLRHAFIPAPADPREMYFYVSVKGFLNAPPGYEGYEYTGPPVL